MEPGAADGTRHHVTRLLRRPGEKRLKLLTHVDLSKGALGPGGGSVGASPGNCEKVPWGALRTPLLTSHWPPVGPPAILNQSPSPGGWAGRSSYSQHLPPGLGSHQCQPCTVTLDERDAMPLGRGSQQLSLPACHAVSHHSWSITCMYATMTVPCPLGMSLDQLGGLWPRGIKHPASSCQTHKGTPEAGVPGRWPHQWPGWPYLPLCPQHRCPYTCFPLYLRCCHHSRRDNRRNEEQRSHGALLGDRALPPGTTLTDMYVSTRVSLAGIRTRCGWGGHWECSIHREQDCTMRAQRGAFGPSQDARARVPVHGDSWGQWGLPDTEASVQVDLAGGRWPGAVLPPSLGLSFVTCNRRDNVSSRIPQGWGTPPPRHSSSHWNSCPDPWHVCKSLGRVPTGLSPLAQCHACPAVPGWAFRGPLGQSLYLNPCSGH